MENQAKHQEQTEVENLFGLPNAEGVYLVEVVEFSDDASEDQWSMAGNMLMGSVCSAGQKLGFSRREVEVPDSYGSTAIGTLPNGIRLTAIAKQVSRTHPWYKNTREPTARERAWWAGLPDPGEPEPLPTSESPGPNTPNAWTRIEEHSGEVFRTKTGKEFTYSTFGGHQIIIQPGRITARRGEISAALEAWPIAGPSVIPHCSDRSRSYVYAIVADERIRRGEW